MAIIDDLKTPSITDMSTDEALEHIRQLRLSRRTPTKKVKSTTVKRKIAQTKSAAKITKQQASALLNLLGGK